MPDISDEEKRKQVMNWFNYGTTNPCPVLDDEEIKYFKDYAKKEGVDVNIKGGMGSRYLCTTPSISVDLGVLQGQGKENVKKLHEAQKTKRIKIGFFNLDEEANLVAPIQEVIFMGEGMEEGHEKALEELKKLELKSADIQKINKFNFYHRVVGITNNIDDFKEFNANKFFCLKTIFSNFHEGSDKGHSKLDIDENGKMEFEYTPDTAIFAGKRRVRDESLRIFEDVIKAFKFCEKNS